jgi:hypothetical protein
LDQHAAALVHWNQTLELASPEEAEPIRLRRAESLAQTAEYLRAVREAIDLGPAAEGFGPVLCRLAKICVVARMAAERDESCPAEERQSRVDQCTDTALTFLQQAREAGYFDDPIHVRALAEEHVWQAMRNHAEYRRFLESLEDN